MKKESLKFEFAQPLLLFKRTNSKECPTILQESDQNCGINENPFFHWLNKKKRGWFEMVNDKNSKIQQLVLFPEEMSVYKIEIDKLRSKGVFIFG